MHRFHGSVCPCGKNHKMCSIFILPAGTGHKKYRGILSAESIFFLLGIPFIKPRCRNYNPSVQNTVSKQRLFQYGFTSGIKNQLFPLESGESPMLPSAIHTVCLSCQNWGVSARIDISCNYPFYHLDRFPPLLFIDYADQLLDLFCRLVIHVISAAHTYSPARFFLSYSLFCPISIDQIPKQFSLSKNATLSGQLLRIYHEKYFSQ